MTKIPRYESSLVTSIHPALLPADEHTDDDDQHEGEKQEQSGDDCRRQTLSCGTLLLILLFFLLLLWSVGLWNRRCLLLLSRGQFLYGRFRGMDHLLVDRLQFGLDECLSF